ncbi:hypothetical protein WQ54_13875 [Bacillus sp. SA1-12]|nr:hypothetical protein WQ54_13875 [Bacillus sp. SA1-12]
MPCLRNKSTHARLEQTGPNKTEVHVLFQMQIILCSPENKNAQNDKHKANRNMRRLYLLLLTCKFSASPMELEARNYIKNLNVF